MRTSNLKPIRIAQRSLLFFLIAICLAIAPANLTAQDAARRAKDALMVKALLRLPGVDLEGKPEAKAALLRHLATIRGSEQYLEIVEKFKLREVKEELLRLAIEQAEGTLGVRAAGMLVKLEELKFLARAIAAADAAQAAKLVSVLGLVADAKTNELMFPLALKADAPLTIRAAAVTAIGRNAPGQKWLLGIVEEGKLSVDLKFAAANALLSSADEAIRESAGKHLSLPAAAGGQALPPVVELVKRSGDATRGKELYATIGSCAKCHKVKGEGKEVGPDLSEIGSKLSKEAMYVSILDPSAGVSVNFETWLIRTLDGTLLSGVLVSQTDDSVELKTAEAIVHKLRKDDIEAMKKQTTSLMPADLQKQLQVQDVVDIVEYLTTLTKPS